MRIEGIGRLGILVTVDAVVLHIPFALTEHAVNTPMKENTKAGVREFLTGR